MTAVILLQTIDRSADRGNLRVSSDNEEIEANKRLVRAFVEAVNRQDTSALDCVVADGFVRHCQAAPEVTVGSLKTLKAFDRESREVFPDQNVLAGTHRRRFWNAR